MLHSSPRIKNQVSICLLSQKLLVGLEYMFRNTKKKSIKYSDRLLMENEYLKSALYQFIYLNTLLFRVSKENIRLIES